MVASSSCLGDTAVAVLGMRLLPSWAHTAHVLVTAPCGAGCGRGPAALGIVQGGHYVLTLSPADCSRLGTVRPLAAPVRHDFAASFRNACRSGLPDGSSGISGTSSRVWGAA